MEQEILELYPASGVRHALRGLYLNQMPPTGFLPVRPFVYSNFISSLDGRIALPGPGRNSHQVPPAIANSRDWRLFQELAAQADLIITSGRYFRQTAAQEAQAELPVGQSGDFDDLREWRINHGLAPQPDIAVFSASLDIPVSGIREYTDRKVYLITGALADTARLQRLSAQSHAEVIICGPEEHVDASLLRAELAARGYNNVYAIAGPEVLHTLAQGNALDRLYHTTAHCLLGGNDFDTFVRGSVFEPARLMPLKALYFDPAAPHGAGQTFAVYGQ